MEIKISSGDGWHTPLNVSLTGSVFIRGNTEEESLLSRALGERDTKLEIYFSDHCIVNVILDSEERGTMIAALGGEVKND